MIPPSGQRPFRQPDNPSRYGPDHACGATPPSGALPPHVRQRSPVAIWPSCLAASALGRSRIIPTTRRVALTCLNRKTIRRNRFSRSRAGQRRPRRLRLWTARDTSEVATHGPVPCQELLSSSGQPATERAFTIQTVEPKTRQGGGTHNALVAGTGETAARQSCGAHEDLHDDGREDPDPQGCALHQLPPFGGAARPPLSPFGLLSGLFVCVSISVQTLACASQRPLALETLTERSKTRAPRG